MVGGAEAQCCDCVYLVSHDCVIVREVVRVGVESGVDERGRPEYPWGGGEKCRRSIVGGGALLHATLIITH